MAAKIPNAAAVEGNDNAIGERAGTTRMLIGDPNAR